MNTPAPLPAIWMLGLKSRCPRCGQGTLFQGFLSVVPRCSRCDLSLAEQDSGDGPVFVALVLVGFLSVAAAIITEMLWEPEWWVHAVIQLPLVIGSTLLILRVSKSLLIAYQYKYRIRGFEHE